MLLPGLAPRLAVEGRAPVAASSRGHADLTQKVLWWWSNMNIKLRETAPPNIELRAEWPSSSLI